VAGEKFYLMIVVDNNKGVMARIATLLARKGYNINSVCVGKHLEGGEALITLSIMGEESEVMNARDLLGKLVNVISIEMARSGDVAERELCLVRLKSSKDMAKKLSGFNVKVLKENNGFAIVEVVDNPAVIEKFLEFAKKEIGILGISRSGSNAILVL